MVKTKGAKHRLGKVTLRTIAAKKYAPKRRKKMIEHAKALRAVDRRFF